MSNQHNKLSNMYPMSTHALSFLSPTGQQVTAVLVHQIPFWETAFYYDMADDWSKNQLWNWLIRSSNCLSQYTTLSTWSSLSNFHTLSIFLGIYASEMINPLCKHFASSISIFIVSVQEFLCTCWQSKCFKKNREMILKAARWSLPISISLTKSF